MSETRPHTGPTIAGSVLGSYRILGEITSGGMGTVFRAEHVLLGRAAAVKLLRPDLTTSANLVQRFVNEAKAVTACKHPGIVEVYDFGYTPDGHAFIVMELLEGEPLGRRMARQRLTELEVAAIGYGIASALKAAHRVGVVHRDLKPDNVFLVPDPDGGADRPKVLDFGIAKLADGPATRTRHTQTGMLIGTPLYMAPEQARSAGEIDHRADLYSLGCIIYHMLCGRPPFVAEGGGEIIALQMFGEVEPPSRLTAVTPDMEQLVLRLLEKEPADRHDSAAEVANALAAVASRLTNGATWPGGAPPSEVAPPVARRTTQQPGDDAPTEVPRKRSAVPMVAVAVTIAVAAGLGVAYAVSGGHAAPVTAAPVAAPTPTPAPTAPPPAPPIATTPTATPTPAPTTPSPAPPIATTSTPAPNAAVDLAPGKHAATPSPAPIAPADLATSKQAATPRPDQRGQRAPGRRDAAKTAPAAADVPDRAIEVIRDLRPSDAPRPGEHTQDGSPIETTVEFGRKKKDPTPP